MTAERTVQLLCECPCTRDQNHGCDVVYPTSPASSTATDLRDEAAKRGWQVVKSSTGSDVCPPCRIAEIKQAALFAKATLSEAEAK